MKPLSADTFFARLLGRVTRAIYRYPRLFVYPQILLFVASIVYTVAFLKFDMSRDNLVGRNQRYHQNFLRYKKEFPTQGDLVVVVESDDIEKNRQFVERLGAKLEAERVEVPVQPGSKQMVQTNLFKDIFFKGDFKLLGSKALFLASDKSALTVSAGDLKDLTSLSRKLRESSDAVSAYLWGRLSPASHQALTNFQGSEADPAPLLTVLTNDLAGIIWGQSIYEAGRFSGVALRPETQQLLVRSPAGAELARLNRLLLEDAYPLEFARSDLEELLRTLQAFRPFIEQFTKPTNLVALFDMVNWRFGHASRETNAENQSLVKALPALERIVQQATASLVRPGVPPSPGVTALFNAGEQAQRAQYITYDNGRIYLVTAQPPSDELSGKAVDRLRELVEQTRMEVPGLNADLTGESVLERDEMLQSQKDVTLASIVSLVLCALIFVYGYQETGRPVKATICLVVGLAYTMAFTTATVGHLNILTITFAPMLIGLAIDFGVHLVTRYEEELRHGRSEEAALTKAMVFTGQGIFTGALTTAGAFLAMSLTNFKGIREMGVICGGGLVICLVPMMTLLPVLLLRGRQNVIDHQLGGAEDRRARIESLWLRRPLTVTVATLVLCGLAATQIRKVYFDYDLLNMQSEGLPAVVFEHKLIQSAGKSVLFGAIVTDSLNEAAALQRRLTNFSAVASADLGGIPNMTDCLIEDQTHKLALIGEIKRELSEIRFGEPDPKPVNIRELSRTLYALNGYLGAAFDEVRGEDPALSKQFASLRLAVENLRKEMLRGTPAEIDTHAAKLGAFQRALFEDVRETFHALQNQDNRTRLSVKDLPEALRNRFVGVSGKYLVQVYPKKDVWQRENQKEFIRQLRLVDPNVTGTPVQLYEYTTLLKKSYEEAALYALGAIVILVLVHFRSFGAVGLALAPVAVGFLWLGGLMGFFNIPLNPANIMTLPLVIGIGVTNGIHILNRFAEELTPSILSKSTGKAVLVSGLTAIAGFGSLVLAKHRGIESLGYVMATGVATCMIAGLTFLPAVLNLMMRGRPPKKQPSADNALSTLGREEPR